MVHFGACVSFKPGPCVTDDARRLASAYQPGSAAPAGTGLDPSSAIAVQFICALSNVSEVKALRDTLRVS